MWKKMLEHLVMFLWEGFYCFGGAIFLMVGITISLMIGVGLGVEKILGICLDSPLIFLLTFPLAVFGVFVLLDYIYRVGDWLFNKAFDIIDD